MLRPPGQQFVHETAEIGGKVLDDDEGHARLGGHLLEEPFQGLQPAGRGANAHDVLRSFCYGPCGRLIARVHDRIGRFHDN